MNRSYNLCTSSVITLGTCKIKLSLREPILSHIISMRDEIRISFPPYVAIRNVPLLKSVSGFKR